MLGTTEKNGQETDHLSKCLTELAACETEMEQADLDINMYRIKKTQGIYDKRRKILTQIPQFWFIVFAENDDFSEYCTSDDLKFLECVKDLHVSYKNTELNKIDPHEFSIIFTFQDDNNNPALIPAQQVVKHFKIVVENGEEVITSEPSSIQWPDGYKQINPHILKQKYGKNMPTEDKKNYRLGMKSFFAWFDWTGRKSGKEYRHGQELTRLIIDDIFPYAVKYYVEAMPGNGPSDGDSSEAEELDVSDDEDSSVNEGQNEDKSTNLNSNKRRYSSDEDQGTPKKRK